MPLAESIEESNCHDSERRFLRRASQIPTKFICALFRAPPGNRRLFMSFCSNAMTPCWACNGFQALVKLGLVRLATFALWTTPANADVQRHRPPPKLACSHPRRDVPWLFKCTLGDILHHDHGEGVASDSCLRRSRQTAELQRSGTQRGLLHLLWLRPLYRSLPADRCVLGKMGTERSGWYSTEHPEELPAPHYRYFK